MYVYVNVSIPVYVCMYAVGYVYVIVVVRGIIRKVSRGCQLPL